MQSDFNLHDPEVPTQPGLGFIDGFRFGCGFSVATAAALLLAMLAFAVLLLILSLAGVSILDNLLGLRPALQGMWPT